MSSQWKERLSRLMRYAPIQLLMRLGIMLTVPRQRVGVGVVALDEEGSVLLLHHVFHPYAPWGLPGGWLQHNEDPEAGALRELHEETGLTAVIEAPVYVSGHPGPTHIGIAFLASVEPGELSLSGEILEARWFPVEALPSGLLPSARSAIEAALPLASGFSNGLPGTSSAVSW
jgi:ADP-ribose pyrophosphatase YjhB (NUDIX family)